MERNETRRGGWIVALLLLINILNFLDRQLPSILISSIKAELHLSDGQIGLMAGLAFAIVYSSAALPLAHLADRWSPRPVLALSLAVWSLMTGLSGLATSFPQLIAARIGVAASEAGSTPAAHALIARLITPRRRALALALFSLGVPLGSMLGLMLGGWINDAFSWRAAFFIVGLPGLAIAAIAWVALPNPPATSTPAEPHRFFETLALLWRIRSFRWMAAGASLYACGSFAINAFAPAFLMRVHHLTATQAGLRMGVVFGVGGVIGTFAGGWLADRLARRDEAWRQRLPAIGQCISLPTALAVWLVADSGLSVSFLVVSYMAGLLYFAPTFAAVQSLVADRHRATASAVLLFCLTLIGSSVGPTVVGWLSDHFAPAYGPQSLRYALCAMAATIILAALCFHRAARTLPEDLRNSH